MLCVCLQNIWLCYCCISCSLSLSRHTSCVSFYYFPSSSLCGGKSMNRSCTLSLANDWLLSFDGHCWRSLFFLCLREATPSRKLLVMIDECQFLLQPLSFKQKLGVKHCIPSLLAVADRIQPQFWTKTCLFLTYLPCTIPFHQHGSWFVDSLMLRRKT